MNELVSNVAAIQSKIDEFNTNAEQNLRGNKAAGVRARKASVELEKLLKEYRKISLAAK